MINLESRRNQNIAVLGLGVSGLMAARALQRSGANVLAWDDNETQCKEAVAAGIPIVNLYKKSFRKMDALVLAPGVPFTNQPHKIVEKAKFLNKPILGDIELLIEACPQSRFIGITGTNGKSTTTALIGHILEFAGVYAQIGGNFGIPALGLNQPNKDEIIVLELSSYQLDLTSKASFDIAVFINLSPDHFDRHGDMNRYFKAKQRIFRTRNEGSPKQLAIIGLDDKYGKKVYISLEQKSRWEITPISMSKTLSCGFFVKDGFLFEAKEGKATKISNLNPIKTLKGTHNWQNAAAATAVVRKLGVHPPTIGQALASYPGLPHRMESIASVENVQFINDSKATNVQAAALALSCFNKIYWIAGGRQKLNDLRIIQPYLPNIQAVFLFGEAEEDFAQTLEPYISINRCGNLETATQKACELALRNLGDESVVLLSPACASFDQWPNFEVRGEAFKKFVKTLLGKLK